MAEATSDLEQQSGTARLWVVTFASLVGIFYAAALDYSLPLYFGAVNQSAEISGDHYPAGTWSALWKYQQTAWIVGPLLAGLLTRRYGERLVWSLSLAGGAVIPWALISQPELSTVKLLALWLGLTGSLAWVAGVSLVQMVPIEKKGLANGLMMTSFGVGSIAAALVSRSLLYRHELGELASTTGLGDCMGRLFNLTPMASTPDVNDFESIFWLLAASSLLCAVVVGIWGQRPGSYRSAVVADWRQSIIDLRRVMRCSKFWALTLNLCVLGGAVFAAANQFMPYRAEELGLKSGAEDHGWIWLQLLRTLMWIPGGMAVGLVAGRRAPGIVAAAMLATFSLAALGIGASNAAWQLFVCAALYEFVRQLMRWSHSGYLSEHMPENLRATAIGCSITCAGLGATFFSWIADSLWNPESYGFRSSVPFVVGAVSGLCGSAALMIFDRFQPIRSPDQLKLTVDVRPIVATGSEVAEL